MAVVHIKPKGTKPLDIEYEDIVYRLSGKIPASILDANSEVPRLGRGATKEQIDKRNEEMGTILVSNFSRDVLPEELRRVLDLADIEQIFDAWSEHVELGKSSSSGK